MAMSWIPWTPPTPTPDKTPTSGSPGSHRDNTVATCPLCQMMAALKGCWLSPDDDEPFGYPRSTNDPPPPMDTEPPIVLDYDSPIVPQVFE